MTTAGVGDAGRKTDPVSSREDQHEVSPVQCVDIDCRSYKRGLL